MHKLTIVPLILLLVASCATMGVGQEAWRVDLAGLWRFRTGEDLKYGGVDVDDSAWQMLHAPALWEAQGHEGYDGFGWYRKQFQAPASIKGKQLAVEFGGVDDDDVVFINGKKVGEGRGCYKRRLYQIPEGIIRFGEANLIAVRIQDYGMGGGLAKGPLVVREMTLADRVEVTDLKLTGALGSEAMELSALVANKEARALQLELSYEVTDHFLRVVTSGERKLSLAPKASVTLRVPFEGGHSKDYRLKLALASQDERIELFKHLLADWAQGPRASVVLSGNWDTLPVEGDKMQFPPRGEWQPVEVPMRGWGGWSGDHHRAWFRKRFDVPGLMGDGRVKLYFEGVAHLAEVWVNGKKLAEHLGGFAPFAVDFTDVAKPRANELLVGVTDWVAGLVEGVEVPKDYRNMPKDSMLFAYGSRPPTRRGIWQEVYLLGLPETHAEDVFVRTSVSDDTIALTITLRNEGDAPRALQVVNEVYDGEKRVLALPTTAVKCAPGEATEVEALASWPDPRLWWPHDPHLYRLRTTLLSEDDVIDQKDTRFGFREFRIDGLDFRLNGRVFKLRGLVCPPTGASREEIREYFVTRKASNFSLVRFHMQPRARYYYEIADEVGMPIKDEGAFYCAARTYALNDERLWKNLGAHIEAMVRRARSYPSVCIWSMENEILHCGGTRCKQAAARIYELGLIARKLDPTRPIEYEGDGDGESRAEVVNIHYPREFGCHNHNLWPNDAYWLGKEGNDRWPRRLVWKRDKPLVMGEFCYFPYSRPPGGLSVFTGEEAYISREHENAAHRMGVRFITDGCRRLGVAGLNPWIGDLRHAEECLKPIVFTFKQYDKHFFGGERVSRSLAVHNDTLFTKDLELRWAVSVGDTEIAADVWRATMKPGEMREVEIAWRTPDAQERTRVDLSATLLADGEEAHAEALTFWAFARKGISAPESTRLALYDPKGHTSKALRALGLTVPRLARLQDAEVRETDVFLVGANAFSEEDGREVDDALLRFVEEGGRAIVLEQTALPIGAELAATLDAKHPSTMGHLRFPGHPILEGVLADDLKWWRGDHFISRAELLKPSRGRFHILAETGGRGGLKWTPLVEFAHGRGTILVCQLAISEKLETEPIAQVLLQNALNYAASFQPAEVRPTLLLADRSSALRAALRKAGVRWADPSQRGLAADLSGSGLVIVCGEWPELPGAVQKLADFARNGGAVLVHGGSAKSGDVLGRLVPALTSIVPTKCGGKLLKLTDESPMTGLCNADFFWYAEDCRFGDWEGRGGAAIDEPATFTARFAQGQGVALTNPAAIARFAVGRGLVVVDLTRWDVAEGAVATKAARIAATLLHNLGASFGKEPEPANLSFRPISLAKHFTAGLRDNVAGDGKGGWTDQGENDMRNLPLGTRELGGVLCEVGEGCIALRSPRHLPHAPKSVTGVPVNGKFHYLYFLQTAAWCEPDGSQIATWRVVYEDGTEAKIPVRVGDNIADWWDPRDDLPTAKVAWTGPNPVHSPVGVYWFRWRNEFPDKTIAGLAFEAADTDAIPIVVAVTGAPRQ